MIRKEYKMLEDMMCKEPINRNPYLLWIPLFVEVGEAAQKAGREGKGNHETEPAVIRKAFICSPYRGSGNDGVDRIHNIQKAQKACEYAIEQGYIPYAPHLYFPQFLSDDKPEEREMGMLLGLTWLARCDELWVIGDRISEGMKREIEQARKWCIPVRRFIYMKE